MKKISTSIYAVTGEAKMSNGQKVCLLTLITGILMVWNFGALKSELGIVMESMGLIIGFVSFIGLVLFAFKKGG